MRSLWKLIILLWIVFGCTSANISLKSESNNPLKGNDEIEKQLIPIKPPKPIIQNKPPPLLSVKPQELLNIIEGEKKSKVVPPEWVQNGGGVSFSKKGNFVFGVGFAQSPNLKKNYSWIKAWENLGYQLNIFKIALIKNLNFKVIHESKMTKSEFLKTSNLINEVSATIITYSILIDHWEHPSKKNLYSLARLDLDILKNKVAKIKNISEKAKMEFNKVYLEVGDNMTRIKNNFPKKKVNESLFFK